jgi:Holliday junction resolvase RusA-like endonuclease
MGPRHWKIYIPIKPKAVQSVRGGKGNFFPDAKVKKWKASILPYIKAGCKGPPSKLPIKATGLRYYFKIPESAPAAVREIIAGGGLVPYLAAADITDNLSKGVIDVCRGLVFEDDRQIWWVSELQKLYGLQEHMELEFMETPDVYLVNGKVANVCDNAFQGDREDPF